MAEGRKYRDICPIERLYHKKKSGRGRPHPTAEQRKSQGRRAALKQRQKIGKRSTLLFAGKGMKKRVLACREKRRGRR